MQLPSLNGLSQFEVIFYEKSSVVLYPWNSPLCNSLVALVSFAVVFWMSRNAPPSVTWHSKNGCEEFPYIVFYVKSSLTRSISVLASISCKRSFCTPIKPPWHHFKTIYRIEWNPIWSVITRVIKKIGRPRSSSSICLFTSMITDRTGRHEVLSWYLKLLIFKITTLDIPRVFSPEVKKQNQVCAHDGAHLPIDRFHMT